MTQQPTHRLEHDLLGDREVPAGAYYGVHTLRALENFDITGISIAVYPDLIRALAQIKKAAAQANRQLGLLDAKRADAIAAACREVIDGQWHEQFVVDVIQGGAGTSTNMNANEVIAGRANEILTGNRGGRDPVHPNDHVNHGQSSNDVIPTVLRVTALTGIRRRLVPALTGLKDSLARKAAEFSGIKKIGRTHLQDAVPMTLGQEFGGYARMVELGVERLLAVGPRLKELALGGTAVGTGLNTHPEFAGRVIA
ncbi:MAG: lyase family protein, partial [Pseudomonadota bacterium]